MIAPRKMRSAWVWTVLSAPAECFQLDLAVHEDVVVQNKADLLVLDIAALDHTGAAVSASRRQPPASVISILRDALDALLLHTSSAISQDRPGLNKVAERHALQAEGAAGKSR